VGSLHLDSRGRLRDTALGSLLLSLVHISKDVVEQEVSGGLLSEHKSLDKLLRLARLVADLTNDLDDDVVVRSLGVDIGNADFAVVEVKLLDALRDGLVKNGMLAYGFPRPAVRMSVTARLGTNLSADCDWGKLSLEALDELGSLVVEELGDCQQDGA
jgi:hypothetical protein